MFYIGVWLTSVLYIPHGFIMFHMCGFWGHYVFNGLMGRLWFTLVQYVSMCALYSTCLHYGGTMFHMCALCSTQMHFHMDALCCILIMCGPYECIMVHIDALFYMVSVCFTWVSYVLHGCNMFHMCALCSTWVYYASHEYIVSQPALFHIGALFDMDTSFTWVHYFFMCTLFHIGRFCFIWVQDMSMGALYSTLLH